MSILLFRHWFNSDFCAFLEEVLNLLEWYKNGIQTYWPFLIRQHACNCKAMELLECDPSAIRDVSSDPSAIRDVSSDPSAIRDVSRSRVYSPLSRE